MLAPSKTADRSAVTAAGPVTWAVTPSGADALTLSRSSATASLVASELLAVTGTTTRAAVPSFDCSSLASSGSIALSCCCVSWPWSAV